MLLSCMLPFFLYDSYMFKHILRGISGPPKPKEKPSLPPSLFGSKTESWDAGESPRLIEVFRTLETTPALRKFLAEALHERLDKKPTNSAEWLAHDLANVKDAATALHYAKLFEIALGAGSFRKISFAVTGGAAEKNVLKILKRDLRASSFEGKAEEGIYLGIKAEYGVEWSLEKTARDMWQNFFDGNGQTLDGIDVSVERTGDKNGTVKLTLTGPSGYDWRELVHLGATTKGTSDTDAGGFGEGAKILSLILLRDYGAEKVVFSAADWALEFYLNKIPEGSYSRDDKGLFARKKNASRTEGNKLELTFPQSKSKQVDELVAGKQLFFSSENVDFVDPSYEKKEVGGFKILPEQGMKGNLYVAGQRMHYGKRDRWNTVENLHLWSWKKTLPKDRDRGMLTPDEVREGMIQPIVKSMTLNEAKQAVNDFKPLWDKQIYDFEAGTRLLEAIVDKLATAGVNLQFDKEYVANDVHYEYQWITDALRAKGNRICKPFMKKIGMTTVSERFKEWQSHIRVEATEKEKKKIELLYEASKAIGIDSRALKEIWVFDNVKENSLIHGQYNNMFFWIGRAVFEGTFLDALHTYVHEAAHKDGPHGEEKFDYTLQNYIARIQAFILNDRERFQEFEAKWVALGKDLTNVQEVAHSQ